MRIEMDDPIAKLKYQHINDKIELLSEIYYFIVVKLTMPGIILPAFLLTIINYCIYGLGSKSYVLPLPIVYVQLFISITST